MNSSALLRLLVSKRGIHSQIGRQLSMNCLKSNSQKVLTNSVSNNDLLATQLSNHSVPNRWTATTVGQNSGHNHSSLWKVEKYLSIGLLGIIPAAFVVPVPAMDYLLALSLVAHIHWGIEAIVVDYIRPSVFGTLVAKIAVMYVYVLSILALGGLFYFNYTDVGLVQALRMIVKM